MQYQGGKARIAKRLAAAIMQNTSLRYRLVEPFTGGGNMLAVLAPAFQHVCASDLHPDLILMWWALQAGWTPPDNVTVDMYETLRHAPLPSPLRGFVGFGCSFGGTWFGNYAQNRRGDNYAAQTRHALLRDIKNMNHVVFSCRPYIEVAVKAGDVVYCDPPYAGTTGYKVGEAWNPEAFWDTAQRWVDLGAKVFVSEFNAPPQWQVIWEKECRRNLSGPHTITVVDRLYTQ